MLRPKQEYGSYKKDGAAVMKSDCNIVKSINNLDLHQLEIDSAP